MKNNIPIKETIVMTEILKVLSMFGTKEVYNILLNVVCTFVMKTAKPGRKEEALKDFYKSLEESLKFYMDEDTQKQIGVKLSQLLEEEEEKKSMPNLDYRFN